MSNPRGEGTRRNIRGNMEAVTSGPPRSVELFSGGGGMALGLHLAGFHHEALVEFYAQACQTLRLNAAKPQAPWTKAAVHEGDVRAHARATTHPVDLVAGGPPCQPFSLGGVHAGEADPRNMFPAALDVVRMYRPRAVVFENVPGLTRPGFAPYFDYVQAQLEKPSVTPRAGETWVEHAGRVARARNSELRYTVRRQLLLASDLGVPQVRRRVFMIALREDLGAEWAPPEADHSEAALLYSKYVDGSYWDEHAGQGDLKRARRSDLMQPPDRLRKVVERLTIDGPPATKRWRTVRDMLREPEPLAPPVDGRQSGKWPNHVGVPGARSYPGHTGSHIDEPAKTIKAGVHGVCGGEAMIRFRDGSLRYLTVREAARTQRFPDWYEFCGARGHAMRQIGNAVAVDVARAVGERLRLLLAG